MKKSSLLLNFLLFSVFTFAQVININVIKNNPSCDNICCGSAEVFVSGDNPPFSYQWSEGSNGTGILNLTAGNYTVTVTDFTGFSAQQTIEIGSLGVDHLVTEFSPQTCFGDEDIILKSSVIEGLPPFTFGIYDMDDNLISFFNSIFDSTHFYQNLAGGKTYRIVMSDDRICSSQKFFTTDEKPEFLTDLGSDINIDVNQSIQLLALFNQNPTSINWSPTTGLSCTDCPDPMVTPVENICYTVEASNIDGCIAKDSICISVDPTSNKNLTTDDFAFDIFPNPVKNELNIKTDFLGKWNFSIIDIHGKVLLQKTQLEDFLEKIDLAELPNGLYFLEMKNEQKTFQREIRFIKN